MANYIKNEVLSEAYSHLDVSIQGNQEAIDRLKKEMLAFFGERAKFLFGEEVTVEIEFEEGSLITKLKVLGSAAVVIAGALTQYGSFRDSVDYLAKDATLLAQSANLEMVFRTKAVYCDRVRIEKRKGVFGRVEALLGELDSIKGYVAESELPRSAKSVGGFNTSATERLIEWDKNAMRLFDKLDHDDTKACIAAGLLEELEHLSATAPWEKDLRSSSFRATLVAKDTEQLGLVEAAATRYKVTVQSLKKSYEALLKQYAPQNA